MTTPKWVSTADNENSWMEKSYFATWPKRGGKTLNYMKQVLKIIGLEPREPFTIDTIPGYVFEFTENYTINAIKSLMPYKQEDLLIDILRGNCKITKIPWRPIQGEMFFFVSPDGRIDTSRNYGGNDLVCSLLVYMKNIFKTREIAENHKPEIMEKYKSVLG